MNSFFPVADRLIDRLLIAKSEEIFFYHLALYAYAETQLCNPGQHVLHDVPENRFPADFDHGLRPQYVS